MHELLKGQLNQQVLDLLAERYWNKPVGDLGLVRTDAATSILNLPTAEPDDPYWQRRLDTSVAQLTRLGLGPPRY